VKYTNKDQFKEIRARLFQILNISHILRFQTVYQEPQVANH